LTCKYNGSALTIGLNGKFLIEMLSVIDTDDVRMEMSTSNRAGIVLPGEKREKDDLLMLVMPVMMGSEAHPEAPLSHADLTPPSLILGIPRWRFGIFSRRNSAYLCTAFPK